jgi:uncharacterized membrane protein
MSWYRHWVERDLERWQAAGWVSADGARAIRSDLDTRKSPFGIAPIFAILGAVLFGFAVMSFVAAHWTAMSKLARLLLLLATLWACYGGAAALFLRQLPAFAHAAVLGGIAVYGASIMLIAQMYHMEGNPPDAVLYWGLGALLAALLVRSPPALAAAFVLISVWSVWERMLGSATHWWFLPVWAASAAAAAWLRWRPGLHLAALSLVIWLVPLGYYVLDDHAHWLVLVVGLLSAVAAALAAPAIDRHLPASAGPLFAYAILVAFAALFIMQFIDELILYGTAARSPMGRQVLLAGLALVGLLAAMFWGLATDNRGALWIAYGAFALEIFALYIKTFGTLLNTSLFFLIAAIMVSGLGYAAYRLHQSKLARGAAA